MKTTSKVHRIGIMSSGLVQNGVDMHLETPGIRSLDGVQARRDLGLRSAITSRQVAIDEIQRLGALGHLVTITPLASALIARMP